MNIVELSLKSQCANESSFCHSLLPAQRIHLTGLAWLCEIWYNPDLKSFDSPTGRIIIYILWRFYVHSVPGR
jgi:hypothetical protein